MDETGGLGVDCVIDNGGKRKSHKLLLRGSALTLCRSLVLVLSGHFSYYPLMQWDAAIYLLFWLSSKIVDHCTHFRLFLYGTILLELNEFELK